MFIYTGKLQWMRSGVDELFVVILPTGPVRVGDTVYLYSQWTSDSQGNKNKQWFMGQKVVKIVKDDSGNDTFQLTHGYYTWELQSQQNYQTVTVVMSKYDGYTSSMPLDRAYQLDGETSTDPARIWTGKLDWPEYASSEPILVVVPSGIGTGKPVLAIWQWTQDAQGKTKVPSILQGTQQSDTPSEGAVKFSFTDNYTLTCNWDEKTEKLAVHLQEPEKHGQDVGPLDLSALFKYHSEDFNPPEISAGKVEVDVRYPQAEPALTRLQTPLPFPRTLIDTLTHTATFLDEAGYMAKYAADRYHVLDTSYHALLKQVDGLNGQIRELSGQVSQLTLQGGNDKKAIILLEKKLVESIHSAHTKEAELSQKIINLSKALLQEKTDDSEAHKQLDAAHTQITQEQEAKTKLEKQVVTLQLAITTAQRRILELQAQVSQLVSDNSILKGQLSAEKSHSTSLKKQVDDLTAKVAVVEKDAASAKKALEHTTSDLKEAKAESVAKDAVIKALGDELVIVKKDRDAKEAAYDQLQQSTTATIQALEGQIATLKAKWPFPDFPDFPDVSFPDGSIPDGTVPDYKFPDVKVPDTTIPDFKFPTTVS